MYSKIITFILVFVFFSYALEIKASMDRKDVALDETVVVTIEVSGEDIKGNVSYPTFEPSVDFKLQNKTRGESSSQNVTIINGKYKKTVQKTFTFNFTFKPKRAGNLFLPGFKFNHGATNRQYGKTGIRVLKESPYAKDISLSLIFSKKELYVNEQVLLTAVIKKKSNSNVRDISPPDIETELKKFFWMKRITKEIRANVKIIKNEKYEIYTIEYIVFPIVSGKIKVPSIALKYSILNRNRRNNNRNAFFSGFFESTISKTKNSKPVNINVKPLPNKNEPTDYAGAVGTFKLVARLDKKSVKTGEALNLNVVVSGRGNEKSIGNIKIENLNSFEAFDPEINSKAVVRNSSVYVTKSFKYVLIPQHEGSYKLGPITLDYFNPKTKKYEKASTVLNIEVGKGKATVVSQGRYLSKEEIKLVGNDIRYIKTEASEIINQNKRTYRSSLFKAVALFPFVYVLLFLLIRSRSNRLKSDVKYARQVKAKGRAKKLLAEANLELKKENGGNFYTVLQSSLLGFVADKVNASAAGFTTLILEENLKSKNITPKLINDLIDILDMCDMYRFANPKDSNIIGSDAINRVATNLADAERLITALEKEMK